MSERYLEVATLRDAVQSGLKEDEFALIKEALAREINILELGIFTALYSEHCCYKSTRVHLKNLPTTGERVIHGPGENAGVVDIGDGQAVVFKVESHNHPTFIEPFQGAATGVGGILRDVFTMGARPIALMNGLRFGDLSQEKNRYLLARAVNGIGSYGNSVGVPTVAGELFFHPSYNGNCLVNAFALGLVDTNKIFLGKAAGIGNSILYVGSKTGRDGIHGAAMASEEFGENSEEKRPTVQVGDPFQEKVLIEACLEIMQSGALVGIQDMGAAGLTSSAFETASRAGTGVRLDLDSVPQRESHMTPYEIMLSESQERMLMIVEAGKEKAIYDVCAKWDLDAVKIGEVIPGKNVELCWHGTLVSSLPVDLLVENSPQYRYPEQAAPDYELKLGFDPTSVEEPGDLSKIWLEILDSPNNCSRAPIYKQYDSTVRTNTVIHPGADAGVVRIKREGGREKGIAMTLDCNSRYCGIDPHHGAALSVAEAYRNISAVGATPIGVSDCLNFGNPERPNGMWQIASGIRGLAESCRALRVPIVSGNASLYNETKGQGILPTPMVAMVGLLADASKSIGGNFLRDGDKVLVIGETYEELGGSEYLSHIAGIEKGKLPLLDYSREIETANLIRELIDRRLLRSCHDCSQGGVAMALAECCLGIYERRGAKLRFECGAALREGGVSARKDALLFSESNARYIVSVAPEQEKTVRDLINKINIPIRGSGVVGGEVIEIEGYAKLGLDEAFDKWSNGLTQEM